MSECVGYRTPLHCAASSNNIEAIQLLTEHGAGVLAFTWDAERETPLDKCCPDSPAYEQCRQFLSGISSAHQTDVSPSQPYSATWQRSVMCHRLIVCRYLLRIKCTEIIQICCANKLW